jgi:hypothetical protein
MGIPIRHIHFIISNLYENLLYKLLGTPNRVINCKLFNTIIIEEILQSGISIFEKNVKRKNNHIIITGNLLYIYT